MHHCEPLGKARIDAAELGPGQGAAVKDTEKTEWSTLVKHESRKWRQSMERLQQRERSVRFQAARHPPPPRLPCSSHRRNRTSQPAASHRAGVSQAGRTTAEPFDAVFERMQMRTARGGLGDPVYDGWSRSPLTRPLPGRSRATRRRSNGLRTCPTRPSHVHVQNEGLLCEVSTVRMVFPNGLMCFGVGMYADGKVRQ